MGLNSTQVQQECRSELDLEISSREARLKLLRIKGRGQAKLDAKMEDEGGRIYEAKGAMGPMCPAPHSPSL